VTDEPAAAPTADGLPIRGYLMHISHYDPVWCEAKDTEKPYDLDVGLDLVDAMAEAGLNLLVVDPKDGLRYQSHPELARHYSVEMDTLAALRDRAETRGIEMAIKLNFSQSQLHQHNHWFRPHHKLFDRDEYWDKAFEIVDELIEVARPRRFFHVGMDEDHWRSYRQYVAAIHSLRDRLAERKLRTLIWNDTGSDWPEAEIHRDKSLLAEQEGPRDVIHVLWDYQRVDTAILRRIRDAGLDLWGAPGPKAELAAKMRDELLAVGGSGMLLTRWKPCIAENRDSLLEHIATIGPICSQR